MKLSEAMARARKVREFGEVHPEMWDGENSADLWRSFTDLIEAVEETLLARQKEADVLLDLAELRRWGGSE